MVRAYFFGRATRLAIGGVWLITLVLGLGLAACGGEDPAGPGIRIDGATGGKCGPLSCRGCCEGNVCQAGKSPTACGAAGLPCVRCPAGESCGAGGQCKGKTAACAPTNCPTGCCLSGFCQLGVSDGACGTGGIVCKDCGGKGCDRGQCKGAPSTCKNCTTGCCDGTICKAGNTALSCGKGGQNCRRCAGAEKCTTGVCRDIAKCGPANCATGCCSTAGTCQSAPSATACGTKGALCVACKSGQTCQAGKCGLNPSSRWSVTISSVAVDKSKKSSWDTFPAGGAPDLLVEVYVGKTLLGKTSPIGDDKWTSTWTKSVGSTTAGVLSSTGIGLIVKDSDLTFDDTIGACTVKVSGAILSSGSGYISRCLHPSDKVSYISRISFKFKKL